MKDFQLKKRCEIKTSGGTKPDLGVAQIGALAAHEARSDQDAATDSMSLVPPVELMAGPGDRHAQLVMLCELECRLYVRDS